MTLCTDYSDLFNVELINVNPLRYSSVTASSATFCTCTWFVPVSVCTLWYCINTCVYIQLLETAVYVGYCRVLDK